MKTAPRWLWAGLLTLPAACSPAANTRGTQELFTGHSATMTALGYRSAAEPSSGHVERGQTVRHPVHLAGGQCYRVIAIGNASALDLEVSLVAPGGQRAATSETSGSEAAVRYCPAADGDFVASLSARAGTGDYLLGVWVDNAAGAPGSAGGSGGGAPTRGTCEAPIPLQFGQEVQGTTANARDNASGTCLRGRGPDVIYSIEVPSRRRVTLTVHTEFDAALYLQHECGQQSAEVSCCNLAVVHGVSRIDTVLDAGTYFVVVDSPDETRRGNFTLSAESADAPELAQVCASLPSIDTRSNQPVHGDSSGRPDLMRGSCAEGRFPGPDQAYSLALIEPSRVRATVTAEGEWDTGLYIRRSCAAEDTEVACNDDADDQQHARITRTLDAGQYTVVVDGYVAGSQGPYSLQVETAPLAGSGVPNDACANAQAIQPGTDVEGDTFAARDDLAGSCGGGGAPDAVYRVNVARRTHFTAELAETGLGGEPGAARLYLTRTCGNARAEAGCGQDRVDAVLAPGNYYLVVDGAGRDNFGQFVLHTTTEDAAPIEAACRGAVALTPGRAVQGVTSGPDRLHASCGNRARSAEKVYSLRLTERRHVTVDVQARYDSVVSIRTACDRESSEVACNDDYNSTSVSHVEADLDPGNYFVVVDGFGDDSNGSFTLTATLGDPGAHPPAPPATTRQPGAASGAPATVPGAGSGGAGAQQPAAGASGGAATQQPPSGGSTTQPAPSGGNPCGGSGMSHPSSGGNPCGGGSHPSPSTGGSHSGNPCG